jgi:sec-independent protein translocase protein TatC
MGVDRGEMSFWDHLEVLRFVIMRVVVVWFILAVVFFCIMPSIFDTVILGPCHNDFISYKWFRELGDIIGAGDNCFTQAFNLKLININLAAPFFVQISTSFWMSVVVAIPYLFYEIWNFIKPALYSKEQTGVRKAFLLGTIMFYLGMLVSYFLIYPLTVRFLATYNLSSEIQTMLSLNSYIDNFMMLTLCMGIAFELPLITWLLSLLGIITKSFLKKYRRYAFIIILVAAAIITPTGDPFTLSVVTIPLYMLYEFSIFLVKDKKKDVEEIEEAEEVE